MSKIEYPEKPCWAPLESMVGTEKCHLFMFMGQVKQDGTMIFLYKHRNTRRYLNIDLKDQTYVYQGETGIYFLISKEEATQRLFL